MTIDLSALPVIGPDGDVTYIPLNVDTFPYADLGAQGRYTSRSTPNNLPELLATLNAQRRSDTHGSLLQVDDQHNLYVNVAAGGGGGAGLPASAKMVSDAFLFSEVTSFTHTLLNYGSNGLKTFYGISWLIILETLNDVTGPSSWSIQLTDSFGDFTMPLSCGGWVPNAVALGADLAQRDSVIFCPPMDLTNLGAGSASGIDLRVTNNIDAVFLAASWLHGDPR